MARLGVYILVALWMVIFVPLSAMAAPYAAMVMDARSGKVLHSENSNTRLHPASLTKMMTLYIAFEAVEHGEISLDTMVRVSKKAAAEPPSKLGLRAGQKIKLRYLIRAAAVKSANDASTAIAEAISGSEAAFARRMNRTAKAMGMSRTTFKNAHGLTEKGHLSTARDMTILGRHVIYDWPEYYNLWSRRTADAGVRKVSHTNTRFLNTYKGADGIKTGYTRAAGFNLVATAERGRERVITTVFGGRSTATRNARVAQLMDLGFKRAPTRMALSRPKRPSYKGNRGIKPDTRTAEVVTSKPTAGKGKPAAGKTVRVKLALKKSPRPKLRPNQNAPALDQELLLAIKNDIQQAVLQTAAADQTEADTATTAAHVATSDIPATKPVTRPKDLVLASVASVKPVDPIIAERVQEVITRVSTQGGRHWGVNVGRYGSHFEAEKVLLKTALSEMTTLDGALRKVVKSPRGYDANFLGMTRETAELACQRLQARNVTCFMMGPS
ncbi:MAG: D-alanyl-D-alanine carboxypeptidase [Marinovum sp.]|nr:D-alanyl-D-alanine carboxypeptidase [Marinovum sp.]